jgi:PAS domain S-box-containing protein
MIHTAGAGCALLETDRSGRITRGNDLVPRMTGFQPAELIGRHLSGLGGDGSGPEVEQSLARAAAGGADRIEGWQVRKDGSRFWAGWVIVARPAVGAVADGFSVVIHDLTPANRPGAADGAHLWATARDQVTAEERHRLARELHDSVSQVLYSIGLGSRAARQLLDRAPQKAYEPIDYILQLTETGLAEIRALIFELRPQALAEEGLVAALTKQTAALRAGYGVATRYLLDREPSVPLEVKMALYRVSQEAMQNIARHAGARNVTVRLADGTTELVLEVTDDGVGFDPDQPFPGHLGLASMRKRVADVGGALEIGSTPGHGTRIRARIPRTSAPA